MRFSCPRTCPLFSEGSCRFRPILDRIGPVHVDSHTVSVKVDYTDPVTLSRAVKALGWEWLGWKTNELFDSPAQGHGFKPTGWTFPCVLRPDGSLAYDVYGGKWGNLADLQRLEAEYALAKVESSALALGWQCERTSPGVLTIYHPCGGVLTYTSGNALATGFEGRGCHEALLSLMSGAGLEITSAEPTAEYTATKASVQLPT